MHTRTRHQAQVVGSELIRETNDALFYRFRDLKSKMSNRP